MIPPDQEIYEVEKRIAERRQRVEQTFRQTGRATLRAMTSPAALIGAAVGGFLLAGGWQRRQERMSQLRPGRHMSYSDKKAAKASVWSGLGMTVLTWFIKSQFGGPVDMAKFVLAKMKKDPQPRSATVTSPRGDRVPATTRK
jgi:hypothetical protein